MKSKCVSRRALWSLLLSLMMLVSLIGPMGLRAEEQTEPPQNTEASETQEGTPKIPLAASSYDDANAADLTVLSTEEGQPAGLNPEIQDQVEDLVITVKEVEKSEEEEQEVSDLGKEEEVEPVAEAAIEPEPEEQVTLLVSLDKTSLVDEGYDADDLLAKNQSVEAHQAEQVQSIEELFNVLDEKLGHKKYERGYTYTVTMTGVSIKTAYKNKKLIQEIPGVKKVFVAPTLYIPTPATNQLTPMTSNATVMVGARQVNLQGYTGKGMRIAILDTGLVINHQSFAALTAEQLNEHSLTKEELKTVWPSLNAGKGTAMVPESAWHSTKIPFMYNYEYKNNDVLHPSGTSDHGTHVAGIAAANKLEDVEVIGVAPEAQLLAMQVFDKRGGANWATVMAALEDCVFLGVDVANMSLGSASGFRDNDEAMTEVMKKLKAAGVEVVVAAGNDASAAVRNLTKRDQAPVESPDVALVGNPSTYTQALSVASADNNLSKFNYFLHGDANSDKKITYIDSGAYTNMYKFAGETKEYVVVPKLGAPEDYKGIDVKGKIALVDRGELHFEDKQKNAQDAGAVGVIIVSQVELAGEGLKINDSKDAIPVAMIGQTDGKYLKEAADKRVTFTDKKLEVHLPNRISTFSSEGPAPDLTIKPEITGVGGNILSTRDNSTGYGLMSGTSMASPQVAGAMTLVRQYLREKGYDRQQAEAMAAALLMSNASPIKNPANTSEHLFVRQQGAGLINLERAINSEAYLSVAGGDGTNRPKLELKDSTEGVYNFSFTVNNIGDKAQTYSAELYLASDTAKDGYILGQPERLAPAITLSTGQEITVPAKGSVEVRGTITLSDSDRERLKVFPNGGYVEGYLFLKNKSREEFPLNLPILGYYGDWSAPPIFDAKDKENAVYSGLNVYTTQSLLGHNPYIKGAPSGEKFNAFSYANPLNAIEFGLMRNAKKIGFRVVDAETEEQEYFVNTVDYATKSRFFFQYGVIVPFAVWNGRPDEEEVWRGYDKEGKELPNNTKIKYYIEGWLADGDNEKDGTMSFEAMLDSQKPVILNADKIQEALKVTDGTVTLTLEIQDNHYVAAILFVSPEGQIMGKFEAKPDSGDYVPGETFTQTFNIGGYNQDFTIVIGDYACNESEYEVRLELDNDALNAKVKPLEYDRLYGFETADNSEYLDRGWFSIGLDHQGNPRNETIDAKSYFSGEYVNGRVIAQRVDGAVVLLSPYSSYWGSQTLLKSPAAKEGERGFITYYDMALNYGTREQNPGIDWRPQEVNNALYAVGWEYDGEVLPGGNYGGSNNLYQFFFGNDGKLQSHKIAAITGLNPGVEMLTLAIDNEGTFYGISTDYGFHRIDVTNNSAVATRLFELSEHKARSEGRNLNVIQSMCLDHSTGEIYWYAHTQIALNPFNIQHITETYKINPKTQEVVALKVDKFVGASSLFIPTKMESDLVKVGEGDASDIQLEPFETTMVIGQRMRLNAILTPWYAKKPEIEWSSDNPEIVTVSQTGLIEAKSAGSTVIHAKARIFDKSDPTDGPDGTYKIKDATCKVKVVESQGRLYGYIVSDSVNKANERSWVTYSDTDLLNLTQLSKPVVTTPEGVKIPPMYQGGAYHDGYVYTVQQEMWTMDNIIYRGCALYKTKVTEGENGEPTVFGDPERIGHSLDIELGNLAFDYNTGRLYAIDLKNGGLAVVDQDTGAVDPLGEFTFTKNSEKGDNVMTSMTIICEGDQTMILSSSMNGNIFMINPDTLEATNIGKAPSEYWFYGAMHYDYNTKNIYWAPSMGPNNNPLYLINLEHVGWDDQSHVAKLVLLGSVGSRAGVEQTVIFTVPETEPEMKYIPIKAIEIVNGDSLVGLVGAEIKLETKMTPLRPTVQRRLWNSSNEEIVTVDSYGKMTLKSVGEADVTVSITDRNGSIYTDVIHVTVLPSRGNLQAFLNSDYEGSRYYDFFITIPDYQPTASIAVESMINTLTMIAGEYLDGYYYGYDDEKNLIQINADRLQEYKVIGKAENLVDMADMAFDYTRSEMFALTRYIENEYVNGQPVENKAAQLVKVDTSTGAIRDAVDLNVPIFTLAVDKRGKIYGTGSKKIDESHYEDAWLYEINPESGECTPIHQIAGAKVYSGAYNKRGSSMTYDFKLDRLYLNAVVSNSNHPSGSSFHLVQFEANGENGATVSGDVKLGTIALTLKGESKIGGKATLGMLAIRHDPADLPSDMKLFNLSLDRDYLRMKVLQDIQLKAIVQPSSVEVQLSWVSDNPAVATVDQNGLVSAHQLGQANITVTDQISGKSASCRIEVVSKEGGHLAYAYVPSVGVVVFDPEIPSAYRVIDDQLKIPGELVGLDVDHAGKRLLIGCTDEGSIGVLLYQYDLVNHNLAFLGHLSNEVQMCDLAYCEEKDTVIIGGGFYAYQFYLPSLSKTELNLGDRVGFDGYPHYGVHGITYVGTIPYVITVNDGKSYLIKVDENLKGYEVVSRKDFKVPTSNYISELAYSPVTDRFYVTSASDDIYSFARPESSESPLVANLVGKLGADLKIQGLGIRQGDDYNFDLYPITVLPSEHGQVVPSQRGALAGETVKLNVAPEKGYVLKSIKAMAGDQEIALTLISQPDALPVYSFMMPASEVVVTAEFEAESSDDEKVLPQARNLRVQKGQQPDAADAITNKADLPQGTTIAWETEPDTTVAGTIPAVIIVTYPDGQVYRIEIQIEVIDAPQNEIYTPVAKKLNVAQGTTPDPREAIANLDEMPKDAQYSWQEINTETVGESTATLLITYGDGSQAILEVPLNVYDPTVHVKVRFIWHDAKGTVIEEIVEQGTAIAKPEDPVNGTKLFAGWFQDAQYTLPFDFNTPVNADLDLHAKWEEKEKPVEGWTVTFIPENGEDNFQKIVRDGDLVERPADPSFADHVFKGWFVTVDGEVASEAFDFNTPIHQNLILTAKWEKSEEPAPDPGPSPGTEWKVTFVKGNGEDNAVKLVKNGERVTPIEDPKWEGHKFSGWYITINGVEQKFDFNTPITSDITLTAKWDEGNEPGPTPDPDPSPGKNEWSAEVLDANNQSLSVPQTVTVSGRIQNIADVSGLKLEARLLKSGTEEVQYTKSVQKKADVYDIYFVDAAGNRVIVEGNFQVTLTPVANKPDDVLDYEKSQLISIKSYENQKLIFETTHFSYYCLRYAKTTTIDPVKPPVTPGPQPVQPKPEQPKPVQPKPDKPLGPGDKAPVVVQQQQQQVVAQTAPPQVQSAVRVPVTGESRTPSLIYSLLAIAMLAILLLVKSRLKG